MKKALYLIAAVSLAASSAMASKARQAALSNTTAITDVQSIFLNPADVNYVGDFATFEMGDATIGGGTPDAEGGFLHTMGDAKLGFYLGKTSTNVTGLRTLANATAGTAFLSHENPFEIFYGAKAGDQNWGVSFSYSNSDKKNIEAGLPTDAADNKKQSAMGLRLGVKNDVWGAYANIGLGSTAKHGDAEYKGKTGLTLGGHYFMNTMKFIVKQDMAGAKASNSSAADDFDYDASVTTLGFTNAWKSEGSMAFYGLAYVMTSTKSKDLVPTETEVKVAKQEMPFTIGAEVLATSWLKLRGSVKQNFFMGSDKTTTTTTTTSTDGANTITHNTTTAAGAGFVWGKNNLDVVMTMGGNGNLDTSTFGTNASYTYMF